MQGEGRAACAPAAPVCVLVLIGGDVSRGLSGPPFEALWWHLQQGWAAVVVKSTGGAAEAIEELLRRESLPPALEPPVLAHECVRQHRSLLHLASGRVQGELEEAVLGACADGSH